MENDNRTAIPEIDHEYTDDMICPYCGAMQSDAWEITMYDEDGEHDCCSCEETFFWSVQVTTAYTTKKKGARQ